jgi:NAD(P)H-dependent FMN reductase
MKVLGVAGSMRSDSYNRALLRAAASLLPPEVEFTEYEGLKCSSSCSPRRGKGAPRSQASDTNG